MATHSLDEETAAKVLRQVEFYFSDINLPRDGFLKNSISESEDGMISLGLICSFSRMRNHLGLAGDVKTEDVSEDTVKSVAEILRKSTVLRVSEDGNKVGRSTELSGLEEVVEQLDIRTIAVSPFEHGVTLEEVESFFTQYGKVTSVRLPRHVGDKRFFCGTALIEFSTEEDAANVLPKSLLYGGAELELTPKKDFDAAREILSAEVEKSRLLRGSHKNDSEENSGYPKGLVISFKLKHKSGEHTADKNGSHEAANGNGDACEKGKEDNVTDKGTNQGEEKSSENVEKEEGKGKGAENVSEGTKENASDREKLSAAFNKDNKDVVLREDIKNLLQQFGTVRFIDFKMGDESGYVRFEEPEAGQKARAAAVLAEEGGLIVKNYIAFFEAVVGDAEKEYWSLLRGGQDKRWESKGNRGRGGRGGFRGGRHNGKHNRSRDSYSSDGRSNKAQRV
ncbi:la protein 1-like [Papaver somniferum]|uniref:la protein 1-like n=1 Tax=Papaver somniferum TaxID=3469 RepID=UPI000E702AF4|nr:la protein 1-like [Papaver somniferum]